MLSPAAAHRENIARSRPERKAKPNASEAGFVEVSHAETARDRAYFAQFKTDKYQLSLIRSRSQSNLKKCSLIANYQEWIDEAMLADMISNKQAEMFVWLTIWCIDARLYKQAFDMAIFAIEQGIKSPEGFERTLPEVMAEQIADGLNQRGEQAAYGNDLEALADVLADCDLIDPIRAKLCKARGLALLESDPDKARELLEQALQFNPRAGTKKVLKTLANDQRETVLVSADPDQRTQEMEAYTLSGRQAARELGITVPTVLKWAKAQPDKLPHIIVPTGKRKLYRFNPDDIEAFKKTHLVRT